MEPMSPESLFSRMEARFAEYGRKNEAFGKKMEEITELTMMNFEAIAELKKATQQLENVVTCGLKTVSKQLAIALDDQQTIRFLVQNAAGKHSLFSEDEFNAKPANMSLSTDNTSTENKSDCSSSVAQENVHPEIKGASPTASTSAHIKKLWGNELYQDPTAPNTDDEVQILEVVKNPTAVKKPISVDKEEADYRSFRERLPTISSKLAEINLAAQAKKPSNTQPDNRRFGGESNSIGHARVGSKFVNQTFAGATSTRRISNTSLKARQMQYDSDSDDDVEIISVVKNNAAGKIPPQTDYNSNVRKEALPPENMPTMPTPSMSATISEKPKQLDNTLCPTSVSNENKSNAAKEALPHGNMPTMTTPSIPSTLIEKPKQLDLLDNDISPTSVLNENTSTMPTPSIPSTFIEKPKQMELLNKEVCANSVLNENKTTMSALSISAIIEKPKLTDDNVAVNTHDKPEPLPRAVNQTFAGTTYSQRKKFANKDQTEPVYESSDSSDMDARVPSLLFPKRVFAAQRAASPELQPVFRLPKEPQFDENNEGYDLSQFF